jgi:hypothetical protein
MTGGNHSARLGQSSFDESKRPKLALPDHANWALYHSSLGRLGPRYSLSYSWSVCSADGALIITSGALCYPGRTERIQLD